ncbi:uncharacterized protein LOC131162795 [Malania oleifera]|uniref:uncharacterized protein LOC131162795 n=1 Tax=Malania oleifera TaxID=397392 RepID=UPI0025AE50AB|nr:uncharacterized protein LOC131162795 [Malania oleifera]
MTWSRFREIFFERYFGIKVSVSDARVYDSAAEVYDSAARGITQRASPSGMTWGGFKEVIFERYFSVSTRDLKVNEFSGLKQGTLTMQRYAAKFIKLSRFAPYLVLNKYKKARRIERGLKKDIRRLVGMLQIRELSILVDKATITETDLQGDEVVQEHRKRPISSSSQSGPRQGQWKKKKNYSLGYQQSTDWQSSQGDQSSAPCAKCHKRHDGER